jgi:transcriptional regulator with GAF, ATPase, and Fis domain
LVPSIISRSGRSGHIQNLSISPGYATGKATDLSGKLGRIGSRRAPIAFELVSFMSMQFDASDRPNRGPEAEQIKQILQRLNQKMQLDQQVQDTTDELRQFLQVDRVVLYHFYKQWEGQVTFESLSDSRYSIFGSTGPDACFNDEYAELYLAGRVRAIADIAAEPIADCHRDFLLNLQVKANLVVPILTSHGLWGLLVAHHCQGTRSWSATEIERMQAGALVLAKASSINEL